MPEWLPAKAALDRVKATAVVVRKRFIVLFS